MDLDNQWLVYTPASFRVPCNAEWSIGHFPPIERSLNHDARLRSSFLILDDLRSMGLFTAGANWLWVRLLSLCLGSGINLYGSQ